MSETETTEAPSTGAPPARKASRRLARLLADADVLADEELLTLHQRYPDEYLGDVLVREGVLLESYLQGLLVRNLHIPWIAADCCTVSPEVRKLLPEDFCRQYRIMPVARARDFLTLLCVNPLDEPSLDKVTEMTGLTVRLALCSADHLETLFSATYDKPDEDEGDEATGEQDGVVAERAAELAEQLLAQADSDRKEQDGGTEEDSSEPGDGGGSPPAGRLE